MYVFWREKGIFPFLSSFQSVFVINLSVISTLVNIYQFSLLEENIVRNGLELKLGISAFLVTPVFKERPRCLPDDPIHVQLSYLFHPDGLSHLVCSPTIMH